MILDISPLERAIAQAHQARTLYQVAVERSDFDLALHLRAAAIQAFEFTYEISLKLLKRYLEGNQLVTEVDDYMSFNSFIRIGYEAGLLNAELKDWKLFREQRGTTSHTYNEEKAQIVFEAIPSFLKEAEYLRDQINKRQAEAE
jgi:nucleotidyltransferase substrate binding protein (TIGR01987 family)